MTKQGNRWAIIAVGIRGRMRHLNIADQAELITRSGLSQPTIQQLMAGKARSETLRARTVHGVAQALEWPLNWEERILAGEDMSAWTAESASSPPEDKVQKELADLRARMAALEAAIATQPKRAARAPRGSAGKAAPK